MRYLAELVNYRHLCLNLAASDLRARFRRSRLGILWAVIQPLIFSLMIAFVWGQVFRIDSYWEFAIYVFSGMLIWEFVSATTLGALDALIGSQGYLKQQRIPLFVFQLRGPVVGVVILLAGLAGLLILMNALGMPPVLGLQLLLVPPTILLAFLFMLPLTIIFSVAGTQFRDLRYITMLLLQATFFLSPVMLTREYLDMPYLELLNYINPVVPLLALFRDPLIYGTYWDLNHLLTLVMWIGGLWIVAAGVSLSFGRKVMFAL